MKNNMLKIFLSIALIVLSHSAYAFKLNTHVWIGQQVWNDVVQDGYVDIPPFGTYKVADDIVEALKNNRQVYLMGNIGPDGFPDMIGGQVAVHPGIPGGWNTDDWLKHLIEKASTSSEKAFAYGYVSHAAADIFAHTYINTYAGDIFDMMDGETDVEARHMRLENYIEEKTPGLFGINGENFGPAYANIATGNALPTDYIMRSLIMGETPLDFVVAKQYMKTPAATVHLQLMNDYESAIFLVRQAVEIKIDKVFPFYFKAQDALFKNADKFPLEYVNLAQLTLEVGANVCEVLFPQHFNGQVNSGKFLKSGVPIEGVSYKVLSTGINTEQVTIGFSKFNLGNLIPICLGCDAVVDVVRNNTTEVACLLNTTLCATYYASNNYCENSVELAEAHRAYTIWLAEYGLAYYLYGELGILREYLKDLEASSRTAAKNYIEASSSIVQNIMKPQGSSDKIAPLSILNGWIECNGLVYVGVEQHILYPSCEFAKQLTQLIEKITATQTKINALFTKYPLKLVGINYTDVKTEIYDLLADAKRDLGSKILTEIVGTQVQELLKIATEGFDKQKLNNQFMIDTSNKGLLLINNVSDRVDKEMKVTDSGHFNQNEYAVIYNSIVLSKLSLLSGNELNRLARNANVSINTRYGDKLFPEVLGYNILFNSIKSIDGNHQWLDVAPPYPRLVSHEDTMVHSYGYQYDGYRGFRMYQDYDARNKVFKSIFKGPLTPGVEKPDLIGFSSVLPSNFIYKVCNSHPYPNGVRDQTCVMEYLFPIISILLDGV